MEHIVKPPALIGGSGVIQNDYERVCSKRTPHTAVRAAFEYIHQLAVADCILYLQSMLKAHVIPFTAYRRLKKRPLQKKVPVSVIQ
jgi:hypothetical protein